MRVFTDSTGKVVNTHSKDSNMEFLYKLSSYSELSCWVPFSVVPGSRTSTGCFLEWRIFCFPAWHFLLCILSGTSGSGMRKEDWQTRLGLTCSSGNCSAPFSLLPLNGRVTESAYTPLAHNQGFISKAMETQVWGGKKRLWKWLMEDASTSAKSPRTCSIVRNSIPCLLSPGLGVGGYKSLSYQEAHKMLLYPTGAQVSVL